MCALNVAASCWQAETSSRFREPAWPEPAPSSAVTITSRGGDPSPREGDHHLQHASHGNASCDRRIEDAACRSESSNRDLEVGDHDDKAGDHGNVSNDRLDVRVDRALQAPVRALRAADHRLVSAARIALKRDRAAVEANFESQSANVHRVRSSRNPLCRKIQTQTIRHCRRFRRLLLLHPPFSRFGPNRYIFATRTATSYGR